MEIKSGLSSSKAVTRSALIGVLLGLALLSDPAQSQQCVNAGINNRSIQKLNLRHDAAGGTIADVQVGLTIGDPDSPGANMSFDLEIYRNAKLVLSMPYDILANDAIQCVFDCTSKCGSIFGDGVCSGCNCSYLTWLPTPIGDVAEGDVISARIVPARGGEPEVVREDDVMRAELGHPKAGLWRS